MDKRSALREMTFGARIAEEEASELSAYFVETDQWLQILKGDADVVYGIKGSGKSAIYALLLSREAELFDRGVLLAGAEDPRGTPVFAQLVADPPTSEEEFRALWRLYFLSLIAKQFRDWGIKSELAARVMTELEDAGLLETDFNLRRLVRNVLDYARSVLRAEAVEGAIEIDAMTGMPTGLKGRIVLREPSTEQRKKGVRSIDDIFEEANSALTDANLTVWLLLDRLDVAFAETEELEANALRALFRTYIDLSRYSQIKLKIFLRTDIWDRITEEGFREASHVTRSLNISWNPDSLLNLVVRRTVKNAVVREAYGIDEADVLADAEKQRELFYRVFPTQVDQGPNKSSTFDWMLSRTKDGTNANAPRELVHLLNSVREAQMRRLEMGQHEPGGDALFDPAAIRDGLPEVSKARLEQTLYAEYPSCRPWIQELRGERTQQSVSSLAEIWNVSPDEAARRAARLVKIGFFEQRGPKGEPAFWVPFLYRGALDLVQGTAEAPAEGGEANPEAEPELFDDEET